MVVCHLNCLVFFPICEIFAFEIFLVFSVLILLFCVLVDVSACICICTSTYKSTVLVGYFLKSFAALNMYCPVICLCLEMNENVMVFNECVLNVPRYVSNQKSPFRVVLPSTVEYTFLMIQ